MQILNASRVLSKLISKVASLVTVNGYKMEVINFRNMEAIRIEVDLGQRKEMFTMIIPRIKEHRLVLQY